MTASQVIVLATPVFLLMIAGEYLWSLAARRAVYRFSDAINSISLGVLSQLSGLFTKLLTVGIYAAVQQHVALWQAPEFWSSAPGVVLALVFYDFCYYWQHRAGHEVAAVWASHVVHHQSQRYNLSTALRQTSSGALLGWIFYLPMALAGVPATVMGIVALIDLLYQFWVHTELVGKLGWFDRVFCSPSNHRVHHAVNDGYLDRNYGGILVLWDRLFGSFAEEREPCVYGTRSPLRSWDPMWANAEVYWGLLQDSWRARRWGDKLRVWIKPPGWRPPDVAARWPKPAFDIRAVDEYAPPLPRAVAWFGALQFLALLASVATVLWTAGQWPRLHTALWSAALLACYWALGALLQGRLGLLAALMVQAGALATVSSALELHTLHYVAKPAVMLLALAIVAQRARAGELGRAEAWLLGAAMAASLAGDVALMLPINAFVPGLACFLVAHLCFLALFRRGVPWFPSRVALLATLGTGAAMLLWMAPGLRDPALRIAVPVYVGVIALMAAQAIGLATLRRDAGAVAVAVGTAVFMLSDSLIAVNRFVTPLALPGLWILCTYYLAQVLIVLNAGRRA